MYANQFPNVVVIGYKRVFGVSKETNSIDSDRFVPTTFIPKENNFETKENQNDRKYDLPLRTNYLEIGSRVLIAFYISFKVFLAQKFVISYTVK